MLLDKLLVDNANEEMLEDAMDLLVQSDVSKEKGNEYAKRIRVLARSKTSSNMLDLVYKTYLYRARNGCFDDYMIYLEKDREPSKRFYLPRRAQLLPVVMLIQDMLDDKLDLLTISTPPGIGKTTIEIFLITMVMGMEHDKCNLMSGHSGDLVNSVYEGVLGVLRDDEYTWKEIFPYGNEVITNAKERTIDIEKKHRFSTLTCTSIDGSLTGRTRCEGFLFADDLCSGIEEAMNPVRLDKLWTSYTNDLKTRKKKGCKEIHIATRWSVHDVIGRLEVQYEGNPRAKFFSLPALNENGESNFDFAYGVGFDTKYFLDMRDSLDDVSWQCLFMNEPIEREGLLYTRDELRWFYELPQEKADYVVAVCDTAEGGGDDTVLPVAYGYGDDWYIVDVVCSDDLPAVTDELCANMLVRHKVQRCRYESNSAGGRTADNVHKLTIDKGFKVSIEKKRTTANKETKIFVNSSWIKEHCLFLDKSVANRNYNDFIKKLCSYSLKGKNKHDDVPDAMAQLSEFIQDMSGREIRTFKRPF